MARSFRVVHSELSDFKSNRVRENFRANYITFDRSLPGSIHIGPSGLSSLHLAVVWPDLINQTPNARSYSYHCRRLLSCRRSETIIYSKVFPTLHSRFSWMRCFPSAANFVRMFASWCSWCWFGRLSWLPYHNNALILYVATLLRNKSQAWWKNFDKPPANEGRVRWVSLLSAKFLSDLIAWIQH